jgi:hypothetical protein
MKVTQEIPDSMKEIPELNSQRQRAGCRVQECISGMEASTPSQQQDPK